MKKEFREFFHLKYRSHSGSSVFQGTSVPDHSDYNPVKVRLVYRRNEELFAGKKPLMNEAERSFFGRHFNFESNDTAIFNASDSLVIESLHENVNAIINLNELTTLNQSINLSAM